MAKTYTIINFATHNLDFNLAMRTMCLYSALCGNCGLLPQSMLYPQKRLGPHPHCCGTIHSPCGCKIQFERNATIPHCQEAILNDEGGPCSHAIAREIYTQGLFEDYTYVVAICNETGINGRIKLGNEQPP